MSIVPAFVEARRSSQASQKRLVVNLPTAEVARIDQWGVLNGKSSRTEAVRELLDLGLKNFMHAACSPSS